MICYTENIREELKEIKKLLISTTPREGSKDEGQFPISRFSVANRVSRRLFGLGISVYLF